MYLKRPRQVGPFVIALVGLGLFATACSQAPSGPTVAGAGSTTSATSASGPHASALAYSQCMRGHGITDFPDPDSSGQIDLKALHPSPTSDLSAQNPRFHAAQQACQALQPTESAGQQHQDAVQALKWAQCFRSHGITQFPDPDSNGEFHVGGIRADGIDVTSPQFQAAAAACRQYQPSDIRVPGGA